MGIDRRLVETLAQSTPIPTTYAGGIATMDDINLIRSAGDGKIDITVGSALDIFGGTGIIYRELVDLFNHDK